MHFRIEWIVYDVHSGLKEISWRIFDNFTGLDVIHGQAHDSPQGEASVCKLYSFS